MKATTRVAAIVAGVGATLVPLGTAAADGVDDQYLSLLSSHGVNGPRDQLIADGHQVCDALGQGGFGIGISPHGAAMLKLQADLSGQGLNQHDVSQLMLDATRAYCPESSPPQ